MVKFLSPLGAQEFLPNAPSMILSPQAERMDVSKSSLGKMLLEEITPVVMILHTPLVEEICQKNKLSLVEMLQPYCSFGKIDVPVRTANDQPYRLQMFKLRLFYASKICQANAEIATEHLKDVVRKASENGPGGTSGDHQSFEIDSPMDDHESMLSLFEDFNREILRSLSFSEHEAFDHPVACLLVVSSKDELPISKFVDIFNTDHLPSLLSEGAMDPKILKHYLLIHDKQEGTPDRATDILADMRATFGPSSCQLLCINSGLGEACTNNPWTSKEDDGPHAHDIGCFLNSGDLNEIRDVMQDFTSKHIIPYMEQKIRSLNQQVSATRKGFRNQIKNLWWRKGKEDASDSSNGPMYSFSSLESQIRVLGDYAFMLRDYELALSSYRLLSTDYKLDKAWKRYAGVQEMAGLCLFMLDQSRKEAEYYMENAFTTYLKTGGQRNATRCGIWWAEMLKTGGQYRDAANVYLHISNEEPSLHAAVILEQASYCYLRTNPPMLRKYGFHRVLAGNQYNTCSQRKLAIRAYNSALSMYKKYAWSYIRDHIHYNLGRWYAIVGIYEAAVQHMLEVLACTHQSLATQKLFFEDFLHIVQELQKLGKKFDVNSLELPSINLSSLRISYEDHRTYASPSAAHIKESTWQSLEDEMVPSISSIRTNWLESLPKSFSAKKRTESLLCVRGETIRVHISFRNPLQIPIDVKGVSLLCGFSSRSQVQESDTSKFASGEYKATSNTSAQDDAEVQNAMNDREHDNPPFVTTEVDFVLNGSDSVTLWPLFPKLQLLRVLWNGGCYQREMLKQKNLWDMHTAPVELNVTPTETGVLTITGVRWTLSGSVVGSHIFSSAPEKKKGGKMRQNLIPWEHKLKFVVLESLPKLVGCIHKIPESAYMGELHHLILELSNVSESSVKNIRLSISNPRFLIPGSKEDLDVDFPSCLQDLVVVKEDNGTAMFMNSSKSSVFIFPKDIKIEGKKNFCWPLWFRAGMVGTIFLDLSVYYEMESLSDEMSFRTLRMHYTLEVLPSLDVSLQITRFPSSLQEFMVRMDIVNNSQAVEFLLRQVSIIGDHFYLSSLSSHILDGEKQREAQDKADISYSSSAWRGQMLPAGQKMSHLFKITEINKFASVNPQTTRSGSLHCDNGQQIYMSNSPLSEFHLQERSSREKESIKEFGSTVDFILISQQVRDNCGVKPNGSSDSSGLSSHHICHCSIDSLCPISWLMEGPQDVRHDFAESFCELRFQVTVRNCSDVVASVGIVFNQREHEVQFGDAGQVSGSDQGGWHAISLVNNGKILSDLLEENTPSGKRHSSKSIPPLVWTLSGSAKFKIEPLSSVVIPLKLCVFYPGVYDLSNYELHWDLKPGDAGADESHKDSTKKYSGQSPGHPFYLMALQSST